MTPPATKVALVVAGGDPPGLLVDELPAADFVVAADSGLDVARALHLRVDAVVGDMDSVSPLSLQWARRNGVTITTHPADKNATDLELAMDMAVAQGCDHLVVVGGLGGRLDHTLATIGLLAARRWVGQRVELIAAGEHLTVVRDRADVVAPVGASVTLLAFHGPATGVTTSGLQWPLTNATLDPGSTLGVSNVVAAQPAAVSIATGVVVVVRSAGE